MLENTELNHNKTTGNKGEDLAAEWLMARGYFILSRNWRYKYWEVDIIASKGNRLHLFEIKTRTSEKYGAPEESVSFQKMECLKNAAEEYQFQFPQWKYVQFNVLAITMLYNKPVEYYLIEDVYF